MSKEMSEYWQGRSRSYSNGVKGELAGEMRPIWQAVLSSRTARARFAARTAGRTPCVADFGCGPGMFSILYAAMGCEVVAMDYSQNMLDHAAENARQEGVFQNISFTCGDVSKLPFPSGSFDVAVCRNVTWILEDPERAYAEWLRVLVPGGKLLVFDANWYRYLVDPETARRRDEDQNGRMLEGWDEEAQATSDEERYCEELAQTLPFTHILRPAWDVQAFERLGCKDVSVDEDIWKLVWPKSEQDYYGATPMFLIEVEK
ncbi:MAG: class I SAM-dependent methyltransferase [Coriobacteriia bacterium]|nr:class I SAM-dependent methyltransferase [Coriobacteriia bacterium]